MPKSRGFTLVELLVVISIIAILSTVGFVSFQNVRTKALDAKRRADIDSIKKAYETNYDPSLNNGQGGYKPLTGASFASGKIPTPPEGGSYMSFVGPGSTDNSNSLPGQNINTNTAYKVCATLSDNTSSSCATSTQGDTSIITQINSLFNPSCDPSGSLIYGLVGYWKMDDNSWTGDCAALTVSDIAGSNSGKVCPSGAGTTQATNDKGVQFGKAGSFDGENDYIDIGNPFSLSMTNNFTVSLFIKADTNQGSFYDPISHGHNSTTGWVWQGQGDRLGVIFQPVGSAAFSKDLRDNQWHHLVAVKSNTAGIQLYSDGKADNANSAAVGDMVLTVGSNINIGRDTINGRYFKGLIDDVRIYNRVLSAGEVSLLYNSGQGCF